MYEVVSQLFGDFINGNGYDLAIGGMVIVGLTSFCFSAEGDGVTVSWWFAVRDMS